MSRVALYPVFSDTLPVARYLKKYRDDIVISELLSLPSCSVCGKDAGQLDNREAFGIDVKMYNCTEPDSWDELYILDHGSLGFTKDSFRTQYIDPMIRIAKKNKKAVFVPNHMNKESKAILDTALIGHRSFGKVKSITRYTVLVGGVIAEANSFEVFLNLFGELSKQLDVAAFSSSVNASVCGINSIYDILSDNTFSASEKVYAISDYIHTISKMKTADMILVHINEALLPFNDSQTNGFGIVPYMMSHVISPDYCVCCLPYDYSNLAFITEVAKGLENRLGIRPDYWHVSNSIMDNSAMSDIQESYIIHVPYSSVSDLFHKRNSENMTLGSLVSPADLERCVKTIIADWSNNQSVGFIM